MGAAYLVDKNNNPIRSTKAGELSITKRIPDYASAVMAGGASLFPRIRRGETTRRRP